ncbi:asd-2 [Pristionchus pacificus]|uniref:Asd-2 n=1 Tax=Pristionchus pacificus TaxID=54126 RepID=A0A2A6BUP6_PRIPA|nr:asd-2 [Pristionchus pacificus]|eukprot:PDM69533.1 asd-2 [Pristionchus pacificus]
MRQWVRSAVLHSGEPVAGRPSSSASDTTNSPASSEAAEDKMTAQQDAVAASNMSDWVCDTDSKPAMRIVEQFRGMMDQSPPVTNSDSPTSSLDEDLSGVVAGSSTTQQTYSIDYLSQLLKDKKQLAAFPNVFHHLERLADEEISRVRVALFQFEFTKKEDLQLPEAEGEAQVITEKVFVPAKEHPDYNFVGRILGPRGMTAKQLEQETGCKIMVRGRGSMRDKKKEEMNRGKPNWEHLSEELHVLIQCEDTPNRAKVKLIRATDEVKKLLVPAPEGEDELKRKQLMELAIINGTYRSATQQQQQVAAQLAAAAAAGKAAGAIPTAVALQAAAVAAQARGQLQHQSLGYDGGLAAMLQQQAAAGQGYGIGADYGANAYADMEGVALKRQRMEIGMLGQAASAYQASQEAYASSGDLAAAAAAAAGGGYSLRRWA